MIEEIKEKFYISIVTNASKKNVEDILEKFSVKNLFDLLITQEDVKNPKPSAEGFLKAMGEHMKLKDVLRQYDEQSLYFYARDLGIQAANKAETNYVKVYGYN